MSKRAIYPGTFDPITYGHLDIIKRSLKMFDEITIVLAKNIQKDTMFSVDERLAQVRKVIDSEKLNDRIKVASFNGLLVDYCKSVGINIIIRGLRPLVDFEYEFEMAMANRELNNDIETIFILTDQKYFYLRSSLIKNILELGGDVSEKVPSCIESDLLKKIKELNK